MLDKLGTNSLEFVDERLCPCGDVKAPRATVAGIARALDESRFLEPIDNPAQGDWLKVQHVGKLDLPQTGSARELEEHLPLGTRYAQPDRETIESLA